MAWTPPSSLTTGTLVTADIWNQNLGTTGNSKALREGGIAMDSQAAGDVVYASSATQLARVAIGTANKVLTSNGSIPAWVTQIANAALPTNVDLAGTLDVTGATTLDSTLGVTGATVLNSTLGVGQASPDGTAHIETGSAGSISFQGASDDLIVENSTHGGITVATPAASEGSLMFLGPTTGDLGIIAYSQASPGFQFHVANAEKARMTPTGLGVAVNDPDVALDVSGGDNILNIFRITQRASGAAAYGLQVGLDPSAGDPVFQRLVNDVATESFRIERATGTPVFNEGSNDQDFRIESDDNANMFFVDGGEDRVGIGTGAPQGVLDVTIAGQAKTATGGVYSYLGKSNEASNYAALQCFAMGAAAQADRVWKFQTIEQGVANAGSIIFQESGGKVGIGLDDPAKLLHIKNSGATYAKVESSSASTQAGILFKTTDDEWEVGLRGDLGDNLGIWCTRLANPAVLVTQAANVGIGTGGTQPNSAVDLILSGFGVQAMKNLTEAQSAIGSHTVFWFETDGYMHYMTAGGTEYKVDRTAA